MCSLAPAENASRPGTATQQPVEGGGILGWRTLGARVSGRVQRQNAAWFTVL